MTFHFDAALALFESPHALVSRPEMWELERAYPGCIQRLQHGYAGLGGHAWVHDRAMNSSTCARCDLTFDRHTFCLGVCGGPLPVAAFECPQETK